MDDLISRQAAIEALKRAEALTRAFGYHHVIDTIREVPTAEKTGKWMKTVTFYPYCSECDWMPEEDEMTHGLYRYCPYCGAKMEN